MTRQAAAVTNGLPNETVLTAIERWTVVRGFCTRWTPVSAETTKTFKKEHLVKIFSPVRLPFKEWIVLKGGQS